MAIKSNGTLWAWGSNSDGQLGDNTYTERDSVTAIGTSTNWRSISSRYWHSLAIQDDSSMWAWGNNDLAVLGDGTSVTRKVPVKISCGSALGLNEAPVMTGICLYPNPASNMITIGGSNAGHISKMELIEMSGRVMKSTAENVTSMDISNLSNGIYMIRVLSDDKTYLLKFVKQEQL
jgi:hypothetical protein